MKRKFNIAIDGPSGVGKSTIARLLAQEYQMSYLNTGAMYRCLAYYAQEYSLSVPELLGKMDQLCFHQEGSDIYLNGQLVNDYIYNENIATKASQLSQLAEVRRFLVSLQQGTISDGGYILEGRDTTTVVAPKAKYRFYLDSSMEERVRRRYLQVPDTSLEELRKQLEERDLADQQRALSPLRIGEGVVVIDTDRLTIEEVLYEMKQVIDNDC